MPGHRRRVIGGAIERRLVLLDGARVLSQHALDHRQIVEYLRQREKDSKRVRLADR